MGRPVGSIVVFSVGLNTDANANIITHTVRVMYHYMVAANDSRGISLQEVPRGGALAWETLVWEMQASRDSRWRWCNSWHLEISLQGSIVRVIIGRHLHMRWCHKKTTGETTI